MPASLPDDLQDALSLGSVEARAGGTGLDVLEDVVGALARLAIEGGRAVVAQPVVVEVGAAAAGKRQLEACLAKQDTAGRGWGGSADGKLGIPWHELLWMAGGRAWGEREGRAGRR